MGHMSKTISGGEKPSHYNENGDRITKKTRTGGETRQTIEFGLIRLYGEKQPRRVSYRSAEKIKQLKQAGFGGVLEIPEANLQIGVSQVASVEINEESRTFRENYTKLPTASVVFLDGEDGLTLVKRTPISLEREGINYWLGIAHYRTSNNGREFLLGLDELPEVVHRECKNGSYFVTEVYRYGLRVL